MHAKHNLTMNARGIPLVEFPKGPQRVGLQSTPAHMSPCRPSCGDVLGVSQKRSIYAHSVTLRLLIANNRGRPNTRNEGL